MSICYSCYFCKLTNKIKECQTWPVWISEKSWNIGTCSEVWNLRSKLNKQDHGVCSITLSMCSASILGVNSQQCEVSAATSCQLPRRTQTVWGTEIASHQVCCVETRRVDGRWRSVTVCSQSVWIVGPCRDGAGRQCGNTAVVAVLQYLRYCRAWWSCLSSDWCSEKWIHSVVTYRVYL